MDRPIPTMTSTTSPIFTSGDIHQHRWTGGDDRHRHVRPLRCRQRARSGIHGRQQWHRTRKSEPAGIRKKVLFVQRIDGYGQPNEDFAAGSGQQPERRIRSPNPGDALLTPLGCGTTLGTSTSTAFVWQRYVNHTAQFLDTTAGAATPATLDQLSCSNTGWTSVPAPPVLTPTSTPATCGDFGYDAATCGSDLVTTNYVYEFGEETSR